MIKNNIKTILALIAILLIFSTTCFAATTSSEKAKLEIVENNVCTIKINDYANFEKKMVSYDLEKKEVDIQLKVTNTAVPIINEPTEIMLVIDNSLSMRENNVSANKTRMEAVTDSAKKLASTLLENDKVKIGVVSFSTVTSGTEGTIADATLRTTPTNVNADVINSITAIANSDLGQRTNIQAGLTIASQNFSNDCKSKYIILLTDGIPNTTITGVRQTFSGETSKQTKSTLENIDKQGITILSVMTGVDPLIVNPETGKTYKTLVEEVFGTEENPTVGKFYFITDNEIEKTITETILSNFKDPDSTTLTNLKIYDYFPQEIVDNFDFSYVTNPTKGNVSADIDLQNNRIIWTIDKLEPGDNLTVTYKLKLKENINTDILDVILDTNEKVDITADEIDNLTSDDTPKIRVTIPEEPKPDEPEPKKPVPTPTPQPDDPTVTPTPIPQTGSTSTLFILIIIAVIVCGISGIKLYNINRKIK